MEGKLRSPEFLLSSRRISAMEFSRPLSFWHSISNSLRPRVTVPEPPELSGSVFKV